jgi:hypothetical protein
MPWGGHIYARLARIRIKIVLRRVDDCYAMSGARPNDECLLASVLSWIKIAERYLKSTQFSPLKKIQQNPAPSNVIHRSSDQLPKAFLFCTRQLSPLVLIE